MFRQEKRLLSYFKQQSLLKCISLEDSENEVLVIAGQVTTQETALIVINFIEVEKERQRWVC